MTFAENLKRLMAERRLTVADVAQRLGVSAVCVQHWRNGRWEPKMRPALTLARLLGVTVEQLAGDQAHEGG